jgi:hypothetical protein
MPQSACTLPGLLAALPAAHPLLPLALQSALSLHAAAASSAVPKQMARVYSKAYRSDAMTSLARVYAGGWLPALCASWAGWSSVRC